MPKIEVNEKLFWNLLGTKYNDWELFEKKLTSAKAELDERQTLAEQFVSAKACNRDNGNALASAGNEEKTMLIIEGIGHDTTAKAIWQKLVNDRRVGITFDLYYCGIAFFDKRFKQNYIVNF